MTIKETIKNPQFKWLNLFIRDFLLILVVCFLHYSTHFNSKSVFLITGMMIVWITWQISDYVNYLKLRSIYDVSV